MLNLMASEDLHQIQTSSRQLPRKDGSETIPNLEEEVVPDLAAISGTRASSEKTSGTEVNL